MGHCSSWPQCGTEAARPHRRPLQGATVRYRSCPTPQETPTGGHSAVQKLPDPHRRPLQGATVRYRSCPTLQETPTGGHSAVQKLPDPTGDPYRGPQCGTEAARPYRRPLQGATVRYRSCPTLQETPTGGHSAVQKLPDPTGDPYRGPQCGTEAARPYRRPLQGATVRYRSFPTLQETPTGGHSAVQKLPDPTGDHLVRMSSWAQ
ncbi:hypothetical protein CesoFtcFv8_025732 [Champsocephalus esox]|uniref:Uncharacterized protein n=1 Tax=Champsocephalus esox TaxID=159716 RepID=A0AAN8GDK6_9TELE|nr:hypothetical protein CesoFtcFv8_025732 [Champsocephalus esox]